MKAPEDGVYELGAGRFKVKKGQDIPEGGNFKTKAEPAANTYHVLQTSAAYQEGVTHTAGEGDKGMDIEKAINALEAAGYQVKSPEEQEEAGQQEAGQEPEASAVTGPSETTQGQGPQETPEAGQPPETPETQTSATTKKKGSL